MRKIFYFLYEGRPNPKLGEGIYLTKLFGKKAKRQLHILFYYAKSLEKLKAQRKNNTFTSLVIYNQLLILLLVFSLFLHAFLISLYDSLAKNHVCTIWCDSLLYHK